MSISKSFKIERTARYFLSDEPSVFRPNLCFVLHGYGQLPQYFLRKFERLDRNDILFVAPEGLHRFYLEANAGRVGSSWMTKEDRLNDIEDYCKMLDQVATALKADQEFERIAILGFSQGVATACRWANTTQMPYDSLIAWSGAFPPDLNFQQAMENLVPKDMHILCGDEDEFIDETRLQEHLSFLEGKGIKPKLTRFKGGHDINPDDLRSLMEEVFPILPNP